MDNTKYKYWHINKNGVCGTTNLEECANHSVDLNGLTMLLCKQGCATASINFKKQAIRKGDIVFLSFDMHFIPLQVSKDFLVEYLSVSIEIADNIFFRINYTSFWDYIYEFPVQHARDRQVEMLCEWFCQTEWILDYNNDDDIAELLTNNLYNLIIIVMLEIKRGNYLELVRYEKNRVRSLTSQFYILVSRYYIGHRQVKFYADKLNITPDYLYKLIYGQSKVSPKEIIDKQVVSAIKTLLINTDMSIKRIASELNFEDVPYMCRYFRRITQLSPVEYRNKEKRH